MKIALCYDRINKFGGAERVLQALHEIWPHAPIYTLTYSPEKTPWTKGWNIRSSFLQRLPVIGSKHELFPPFAAYAWKQFDFSAYDVVISVTSAEAKSISTPPSCLHICYCLTPTRYYWSGYFEYLKHTGFRRFGWLVRAAFQFFAHILRVNDYFDAQKPTVMVGISDEVCRRIKKYYRRDSHKIYPPVEVDADVEGEQFKHLSGKPYFLVVSRLVPYKHVDIVVEAFNRSGFPLVIVGVGSEYETLKSKAKENIYFAGFVPDEKLGDYYRGCMAVIFSPYEDFGIVPVEAQAYGKPVIAYRAGGALETVLEGQTGLFFNEQSVTALNEVIFSRGSSFESVEHFLCSFGQADCRSNAARFRKEYFQEQIQKLIEAKFA